MHHVVRVPPDRRREVRVDRRRQAVVVELRRRHLPRGEVDRLRHAARREDAEKLVEERLVGQNRFVQRIRELLVALAVQRELNVETWKPENTPARCATRTRWSKRFLRSEERNVETVSIRAHSSFRIIVDYTPKKSNRGESSLELRGQSFFLLFEIRSKRDYGEIGLFCRAQTCQSRLAVTPAIHYRNCVPGGSFTQSMVITNEVGNLGFFWTNIGSLRWRVPRLSRVLRRRCGSRIPRWNRWPRRTWRGCRRRSLIPSPISPIPSLFQKTGRFPSR